jgi:hypothetical protein
MPAEDLAAVIDHLPPKGKQTVRYYGRYSNKTRGQQSPIPDRIIRPLAPPSNQQSSIENPPRPATPEANRIPPPPPWFVGRHHPASVPTTAANRRYTIH